MAYTKQQREENAKKKVENVATKDVVAKEKVKTEVIKQSKSSKT